MYKSNGIKRFYSGADAFFYGALIAHAGMFVCYEASKKWLYSNYN